MLRRFAFMVPGICFAFSALAVPREGRYTDTTHRFSLVPPTGWKVNKKLIPHYAVLVEPTHNVEDEATTIGTYGESVRAMTLDAFVKATRAEIAKQKGMTIYGEKSLTLDGEKAYSWRMRVKAPNWPLHENRQVFCVHNSQSIILTLTALPANIKQYDSVFDDVLASFRWEAGTSAPPKTVKPAPKKAR